MTLNCLIVDDEPLALDLLESYVKRTPFLHLAGRCESAISALSIIKENPVNVVFLDIQMPELNGLELSHLIGDKTKIIFITAFEQYALEGFRSNALDYLLKPIDYAEFLKAAGKAQQWYEMTGTVAGNTPKSIFIKTDYKLVQIDLEDILFIEGVKDYIRIHTSGSEGALMTLMSMKTIEDYLPSDIFIRVHRSFIVNINKIKLIERNRIIFGKTYIPISDSYKEQFMEVLNRRMLTTQI